VSVRNSNDVLMLQGKTVKHMRAVWKIRGLTLLLWIRTLWRCSNGFFFKVPPLV